MKPLNYLNKLWPDTGRKIPEGKTPEIHITHAKWQDLMYFNGKNLVYVSTLPVDK